MQSNRRPRRQLSIGPADSLNGEWFRPRSNTLRHQPHLCFLSFLLFPTAELGLEADSPSVT
jgi:hypothetical protein